MANNLIDLKERLKSKLREIFQFENEDLDFGIYKIMNYKRKEIERFIEKELIDEIKKQLELAGEEEISRVKEEFEEIKQKIKETLGENAFENGELKEEFKNTPLGKEYHEKKRQLEEIRISEDLEKEIYNHLINFFSRYYDKGDFISKRRYGKNEKYVVPYNGEEVLLYWANKDQYYIKTTEYFRRYTFKVKDLTVNFRVVEAEEEKGNIKSPEKKFFVLNDKVFDFDKERNELNIYFEYRGLTEEEEKKFGNRNAQDVINEETIGVLKEKISQNSLARLIFEKDPKSQSEKSFIEKHLYRYTRRNTTDYFIHKDLKGFLERELDFYIKNEFLQLEDLQVLEQSRYFDKLRLYLIGVKTFRNIALKIIEFLAQIENFQKKIWEKKKFVIDTHYVITLDKIKEYAGEEFLESILDEILNNENQLKEWKELFGIKVKGKEDLIVNEGQLKLNGREWKKLPIDTKYFDEKFKWKLLVALTERNNLDDILDGVLIKSENFQALNLLLNKYHEKVQTIYIDPPYNTGGTEFIYKNNYRHSSWITMMENRINIARDLLTQDGLFVCSIDNYEIHNLRYLLDNIFNNDNMISLIAVVHNPGGRSDDKYYATSHEYFLVYAKNILSARTYDLPKDDTINSTRRERFVSFMRTGSHSLRSDRPNLFYPIYFNPNTGKIYLERTKGTVEILPIDSRGVERVWRWGKERLMNDINKIFVKFSKGKYKVYVKETEKLYLKPKTIWNKPKYNSALGTILLQNLFGKHHVISFPKSLGLMEDILIVNSDSSSLVFDFFAGSGTTAHAVMKLNKEDGGKRKFILVEMADYFDTVIIPRIKKIAYSFNWKEGKPQDMDGIGIFFKYHTLEQYEDALENIEFEQAQKTLYEFSDYFVKYMLEWETKNSKTFLNIYEMKDPFNYKLKIIENYQQKIVNVDLVETFNYLLGLYVSRYKVLEDNGRKYVFVFGEKDGKKIAIVWRNMNGIDLEKDKGIVEENIREFKPDEIYINEDAVVKNFKPIEPLFKSLMFEKVK